MPNTTRTRPAPTETAPPERAQQTRPLPSLPVSVVRTKSLRDPFMVLLMVAIVGLVGVLYLMQTTQIAGLGYQLSTLEAERHQASLENQQLNYAIAQYEALPRIELAARGPLRMQPIAHQLYISVERPAQTELTIVPTAVPGEASVWDRVVERLTSSAAAENPGPTPTPTPEQSAP